MHWSDGQVKFEIEHIHSLLTKSRPFYLVLFHVLTTHDLIVNLGLMRKCAIMLSPLWSSRLICLPNREVLYFVVLNTSSKTYYFTLSNITGRDG